MGCDFCKFKTGFKKVKQADSARAVGPGILTFFSWRSMPIVGTFSVRKLVHEVFDQSLWVTSAPSPSANWFHSISIVIPWKIDLDHLHTLEEELFPGVLVLLFSAPPPGTTRKGGDRKKFGAATAAEGLILKGTQWDRQEWQDTWNSHCWNR